MEPIINEKNKEMYFVAKKLDLPVFLLARNRIKYNRIEPMRGYITKKRLGYTSTCNKENATETATTKKQKHVCGFYGSSRTKSCPTPRVLKYSRDLITTKSWQLPPNRYNVRHEPFKRLQGSSGAHWAKPHMHKAIPTARGVKTHWKFYELQRETERMQLPINHHKGIFLTNARERRATSRSMASSPLTCYHDPKWPAPNAYHPGNLMKFAPRIKAKPRNPHIFLPHSCIPRIENCIHPKHTSFKPGPGRYEIRYPHICPCYGMRNGAKLIYQPELQLIIDRQKRLKFRRLQYIKIKAKKYCTPDWRHVQGHGHQYLFRNIPPKPMEKPKLKTQKDTKKTERVYKLFPDARYIGMINDPIHQVLSHRFEPMLALPKRIYFNCMAKRIVRRQLRNNKKIAFNSGQERFKDLERPPILTLAEQEARKRALPIDRQLHDYPVMQHRPSEIKGRLFETPLHMRPTFELELRKRLFKFLPLPTAKVLVTEADLRPDSEEDAKLEPFYGRNLDVMNYLRTSVQDKDLEEIMEYREQKRI